MMFTRHKNFRDKTLREIRWWAWAAAVLPLASLATLFFIWAYGSDTLYKVAMISGSSAMFTIAVVWWWWALRAISTLIEHWDETRHKVEGTLHHVKEIRGMVRELSDSKSDK